MAKKRIIIIFVSITMIVVFILLNMFVFALSKVEISFLSPTVSISEEDYESIINSASFKMGRSVLFYLKDANIVNLEAHNPYLKVINIETIFPSKFKINAIERIEIFNLKTANNTFISVDEELKVLQAGLSAANVIEVKNLNSIIQNSAASAGKFLSLNNTQTSIMQTLFYSFTVCKFSAMQIPQFLKSVDFDSPSVQSILLTTNAGVKIQIERADRNLLNKIIHAVSVFDALSTLQKKEGTILIEESTANFETILQSYIF